MSRRDRVLDWGCVDWVGVVVRLLAGVRWLIGSSSESDGSLFCFLVRWIVLMVEVQRNHLHLLGLHVSCPFQV